MWRFIALKPGDFFEQWRQSGEKFVAAMQQFAPLKCGLVFRKWHNVVGIYGTPKFIEAGWLAGWLIVR